MSGDNSQLDIETSLVLSAELAQSGGYVNFESPTGFARIRIPENTQHGTRMRLKGMGYRSTSDENLRGALYLVVKIDGPESFRRDSSKQADNSTSSAVAKYQHGWRKTIGFSALFAFFGFLVVYGQDMFVAVQYQLQTFATNEIVDYPIVQRQYDLSMLRATLYEHHRSPSDPKFQQAKMSATRAQGLDPSTVGLLVGYTSNGVTSICSASIVAQDRILTAASCLNDMLGQSFQRLYFLPNAESSVRFPSDRIEVTTAIVPANKSIREGGDMALLTLASQSHSRKKINGLSHDRLPGITKGDKLHLLGYLTNNDTNDWRHSDRDCTITSNAIHLIETDCLAGYGMKGAPAFIFDSEVEQYYVAGVVSDINSSANFITPLSTNRRLDLNLLISKKISPNQIADQLQEAWTEHVFKPDKSLNILIRNSCGRSVGVAMVYREINGGWVTRGFKVIPPRETHEIARSDNTTYYLHALKMSSRRTLIYGNSRYEVPGSGVFGFQQFQADYGDSTYNISSC